jgi:hypothetical protein
VLEANEFDNSKWYTVCNDHNQILIYTTSGRIAHYVSANSKGIPKDLYLTVGGDRNTHPKLPLWQFKRLSNR